MAGQSNLARITASGAVAAGKRRLKGVCVTAAAATATVAVDDSADGSGTDLLVLSAVANTSACWRARDAVPFSTAIYGTLTGSGAAASFEYE